MDCISPILDIATRLWDCTDKRAVYVRELPENLISLRNAMEKLQNVYEDVKDRVEREEKLQKKRTRVADGWLRNVEAIEKEVKETLAEGDEEIQRKCLGTCCPKNCRASYKIGKKVMDVVALKNREGLDLSVVAEPLSSPPVILRPSEKTVGLDLLLGEVWSFLQDDKVGSMGIYGMGGVGKTTLLKRIDNDFLQTGYEVDVVIWVVVSQQGNVEKVQETVLNKLEIAEYKWKDRSVHERAEEIFSVLQTKKFVLLLDDIWKQLDLLEVGIPPLNDQKKSKVIFTTRFSTVCHDMGAKSIEVECLAWEEAFSLFRTKVGEDTLDSHPDIQKLAEIFVKECKGLPLALITVGRAMAEMKTPEEWEKKIQILKRYPSEFPGMGDRLFPLLAFSYDNLCDDTVKSCFLYCSIYPEDYEIPCNQFTQLWMGEGFLDEYDDVCEANTKGENIIEKLKLACLLTSGESHGCVKMHDVIRDMALWIACENGKKKNKFVVKEQVELIKGHEITKWKKAQRISVWNSGIEERMAPPPFPNLETLLSVGGLMKPFLSGFFRYMPVIRVLALVENYELTELPVEIGELVTLQYLNLSLTGIKELPMELKKLTKLRCLVLDDMLGLKTIPHQMISSLSSLESFSFYNSGATIGDCSALLQELESLEQLNEIFITLRSVTLVKKLLKIHGAQEWWDGLEWEDQTIMQNLTPYFVPIPVFAITIEV